MTDRTIRPDREPDFTAHGEGPPPEDIVARAEAAYHAELAIDAMGDPEHAPRGWWNLKLWDGP